MERFFQALLIVSTLALSWLAMMAVHEFGHVLHAWLSGGTVAKVVLHPLTISRTDLSHNPHPLFVAWGGAIWGCIIPTGAWALARVIKNRHEYLLAFFSGFCLIANGAYLAGGSLTGAGDAGDLLRHGAARWHLLLFGLPAVALGLYFWHGLGRHFGLGAARPHVDRQAALAITTLLVIVVTLEIAFCPSR